MERKAANAEILLLLLKIAHAHPDLRFNQILSFLKVNPEKFYEESKDTLNIIRTQAVVLLPGETV